MTDRLVQKLPKTLKSQDDTEVINKKEPSPRLRSLCIERNFYRNMIDTNSEK